MKLEVTTKQAELLLSGLVLLQLELLPETNPELLELGKYVRETKDNNPTEE